MNSHRESWRAWFLWSLVALAMFAAFWFYLILHRLVGLSLHQLVRPFVVLAVLQFCFAAAAKPSREKFINAGRVAPMVITVCSFFLSICLWVVYYAREFGYLNSSAALALYIGSPVFMGVVCLLMVPFMPWMAREFMPREFRGTEESGIRK
jgi:hypothetical protein